MADEEPNSRSEALDEIAALRRQHAELGQRLAALERQMGVKVSPVPGRKLAQPGKGSPLPANLEQLIGLHGFSWLGILALVTGLGLFIRYAFLEHWLGPLAILLGSAAVGAGMIFAGEWIARKETYRIWAHALMGGGIAVLYFLVYAGYHFDYFQQVTHLNQFVDTLLLMGVVGLAIWLALRRQSQSLASRAFVLGFATSLLSRELVLLTLIYNLILSAGLVGVAAICRWQSLGLVGVLGSYTLHGLWLWANPDQALLGQSVLLIYFALYAVVIDQLELRGEGVSESELPRGAVAKLAAGISNPDRLLPAFWKSSTALGLVNLVGYAGLALLLREKTELWPGLAAALVWLGLGLGQQARLLPRGMSKAWQAVFCAHWMLAAALTDLLLSAHQASDHARSGMLLLWALAAAGWAHGVRRWDSAWVQAGCQWLTAGAVAGIIAIEAPAHWLGLLWSLEALALLWLGRSRPTLVPASQLLVLATAIGLRWQDFGPEYPLSLAAGLDGAAVLILLTIAWRAQEVDTPGLRNGLNWPAGISLALWLSSAMPSDGLSLAWAVAGCVLVLAGFVFRHPLFRFQGLTLLLLTGAKVFLLDLRELGMGWRILSLLVLGGLLLGIALIYTRRQKQEAKPESSVPPSDLPAGGLK